MYVVACAIVRKKATALKKKTPAKAAPKKAATPAKKVDNRGRRLPKHMQRQEEKYDARLEVCKEWKRAKGRFPKANRKDKEEWSLYKWLQDYKFGGRKWTQARWEKLNEAFGEGWEKECFPCLETGTWGFQPGHQHTPRDETQWDAILDAVMEFWVMHGRFPRRKGGDADETRLYQWLQKNMDTTSTYYTPERANKLAEALNPLSFTGDWRMDTFTTKFAPEIRALADAAVLARQHPESSRRGEAIPNRLATADNLMARQNLLRTIQREDTETTETTNPTMI